MFSRRGLNGFQSLEKLPPALAPGRGIQKRFGVKRQHRLQESCRCKRNFYSTSNQSSILISLGFCARLESRCVIILEILCSSKYPCRVLYMKETSGILQFLKAPVKNQRIHIISSLIGPPFLVLWKCAVHALGTVINIFQVRKLRIREVR